MPTQQPEQHRTMRAAFRALRNYPRRPGAALVTIALLLGVGAGAGMWVLWPQLPTPQATRQAWVPSDAWLLDRHGNELQSRRIDFTARRWPWIALSDVNPALVAAVLRAEDRRFYNHPGVDPLALAGALRDGLTGRGWRGASTLSMQVAAWLDPQLARSRPGQRTAITKLRQVIAALVLETRWSKSQIIEAYMNLASWRGEATGIGAASALLFGKPPAAINGNDAWLLAAMLRAPNAPTGLLAARACRLAGPAADCAQIGARAEALGVSAVPPTTAGLAPHLATRLLDTPGQRLVTTLDAGVQQLALTALREQLATLDAHSVRDGAAIVVDNATGAVLAWVGSAGPASTAPGVDGVLARRQAGSTLKPFLYALAFERRLLTPASLLEDAPTGIDSGGSIYAPRNYDHRYRGLVSVRSALASSLNIPAVRTLELIGIAGLHSLLGRLGYGGLNPDPEFHGASLALGSPEVSLVEQAAAYRALADGGRYQPLVLAPGETTATPRQTIDPAAAWLVADILADRTARAAAFGFENPLATPGWAAVKTGTSVEMRDNWCVGFTTRHTVAVWVGNFEGDPMRDVSGVSGAAPAWAQIVRGLQRGDDPGPPSPAGVVTRAITFEPAVEPPRTERFMAGTELTRITAVPASARPPRIRTPERGLVLALDPDIPARNQRLPLEAEGGPGPFTFRVDGHPVAGSSWQPRPGRHRFTLHDTSGRTLDTVEVVVR